MRGLIAVLMVFLIAGCGSSARTATATISTVPIAEWTVPASAEFLPLPDPASKVDVTFNVEERYNYSQRIPPSGIPSPFCEKPKATSLADRCS